MAAPTEAMRFGGGRLIRDPDDLSDPANNCGGTVLGTLQAFALVPFAVNELVTAEELGSDVADLIHLRYRVAIAGVFTTFDQNAIVALHLNASTNVDGIASINYAATPGSSVGSSGSVLLYLPDRLLTEPACLIYDALPDQPMREVKWSNYAPRKAVATWLARRDASGRKTDVDLLSRLSL